MPKVSKSSLRAEEQGPVTERRADLAGYTVSFLEFHQDVDGTPLMKGLPGDRCQCPHWGLVVKGKVTMRYADREEVFEAGDAYYAPAGHIPVKHEPGTELVMFSPTHQLHETEAVMMKNIAAMKP